jgi:hypothetical protein
MNGADHHGEDWEERAAIAEPHPVAASARARSAADPFASLRARSSAAPA